MQTFYESVYYLILSCLFCGQYFLLSYCDVSNYGTPPKAINPTLYDTSDFVIQLDDSTFNDTIFCNNRRLSDAVKDSLDEGVCGTSFVIQVWYSYILYCISTRYSIFSVLFRLVRALPIVRSFIFFHKLFIHTQFISSCFHIGMPLSTDLLLKTSSIGTVF